MPFQGTLLRRTLRALIWQSPRQAGDGSPPAAAQSSSRVNSGPRLRVAGEPAARMGAEPAPSGREAPAGPAGDGWAGWQDGGAGDAGGRGAGSRSQGGDAFAATHMAPFPGAPASRPCMRAGRPPGPCVPYQHSAPHRRPPRVCGLPEACQPRSPALLAHAVCSCLLLARRCDAGPLEQAADWQAYIGIVLACNPRVSTPVAGQAQAIL